MPSLSRQQNYQCASLLLTDSVAPLPSPTLIRQIGLALNSKHPAKQSREESVPILFVILTITWFPSDCLGEQ